jgi:hypothetical protein
MLGGIRDTVAVIARVNGRGRDSMTKLDRIFDPRYEAVDLFTNRVSEHQAFADAVLMHVERTLAGTASLANPVRRNVLSFYGIGGIGKTELSKRLERWIHGELQTATEWGDAPAFDQSIRTARIDFHGSRVVKAVDVVLCLRAALAGEGRRFQAFDLGLAVWWSLARPGMSLPDIANANGNDVRTEIVETLGDVVSDAGAGSASAGSASGPEFVSSRRSGSEGCATGCCGTVTRLSRLPTKHVVTQTRTSLRASPASCRGTSNGWYVASSR